MGQFWKVWVKSVDILSTIKCNKIRVMCIILGMKLLGVTGWWCWVMLHYYVTWGTDCCHIHFVGGVRHISSFVQDCSISIALAMEILQSCTKPSIYSFNTDFLFQSVWWYRILTSVEEVMVFSCLMHGNFCHIHITDLSGRMFLIPSFLFQLSHWWCQPVKIKPSNSLWTVPRWLRTWCPKMTKVYIINYITLITVEFFYDSYIFFFKEFTTFFVTLGCHWRPRVLLLIHASVRPAVCLSVRLSVCPSRMTLLL